MPDEIFTPAWIFDRLGLRFDMDVASPPGGLSWVPADRFIDPAEDGLSVPWVGRVWMNPPYSDVTPWVERFIEHHHGIALLPFAKSLHLNRIWDTADGMAVPPNSGSFLMSNGKLRLPVYLAAFGDECVDALSAIGSVRRRAAVNAHA